MAIRTDIEWAKYRQVGGVLCDGRVPYQLKGHFYKTIFDLQYYLELYVGQ